MAALLLGVDLGTSYFKVGLFDEAGSLKGLGRVPVEAAVPAPGRAELAVDFFWERLKRALADALARAGARAEEIIGISYGSQANTFVLLDRNDAPLTPLVLWNDARAEPMKESFDCFAKTPEFGRRIGSVGFSGKRAVAKWHWFSEHEPAIWARAERLMTISDYFTYAMTGERAGDAGTAAFLGIYDLATSAWWPPALEAFGLGAPKLSRPLVPGTSCARTHAGATALLGLPAGIPFAVGSLDHHVAALGSGLGWNADVSISTGTVLAAMTIVEGVIPQPGCFHGPHFGGRGYYRLTFDAAGAGQLEEYQRRFAPSYSVGELIALAADVSAESEPTSAPSQEADARAHGAHIRFLLEKVAATHVGLVKQLTGERAVRKIVATGGGARSTLWLQIKAEMFRCQVSTGASPEPACLGAAMLGGVAAGLFRDPTEAAKAMFQPGQDYVPLCR